MYVEGYWYGMRVERGVIFKKKRTLQLSEERTTDFWIYKPYGIKL